MKKRNRDIACRFRGRTLIAAAVVAALAAPAVGWAQSADANLRGTAAANAEITAKNVATGAVRRTKASADGTYTIVGLPPGTYRVDAGPGTERVVTLTVASTATLDLTTGAPAVATGASVEEVIVSAQRLTEVRTSEVGMTISVQQIEAVPQITRNFLEFADTVPGMAFAVDQNGNTSLRGGAQTTGSVNVFIDGVGQKNYLFGGVTGQFSSQGNPFPQLGISEYKVITSNYKAEFDQVSSAAVTAQTKSGTNEFHGDLFGTFSNDDLRSATPAEDKAGKKSASETKEFGAAFGGPILQDRLHFFVTYEGKRYQQPIVVTPGVSGIEALLPADVVAQFGPTNTTFDEDLFFGKIDWELSDRDRLELSGRYRDETGHGNFGGTTAESAAVDRTNDDTRLAARWQHSADSWFNDLVLTYEDAAFNPVASSSGDGFLYTYNPTNNGFIIATGAAGFGATQDKGQKGTALQDDLTFTAFEWHGEHTLKMGAKYKDIDLTAQDSGTGNPQFTIGVSDEGTEPDPYKVRFVVPVPGLNHKADTTSKQFGVYFQDDWQVNEHLTLNLGLRWDYEETDSFLDYKTPQNVIDAINSQDPNGPEGQTFAQTLALGGVNINDYISDGHNRSADSDNWQPRLGFSYDINGDQAHVVFGGAGRSYDRNLYQWTSLELSKGTTPNFEILFDVPGHDCGVPTPTCVAWDPKYLGDNGKSLAALVAASNANGEVFLNNNDQKVPYSDQFSVGMRNRLGDWMTSAAISYVKSHDGFVYTLGSRYSDGAFWVNGGQPWGHNPAGFGNFIIGNNGIETRTTQVLLSAEKPFTDDSRWAATFAYTYTDGEQNRDINETFAFDEETIGDYPFITSNAAPEHRFVATGSYGAPWGFLLAAKLTLATPTPVNALACYGKSFPTGSNCTPIAGKPNDTFGFRSLDLQVTKDFQIGDFGSIYLRVDWLNVFNNENFIDTSQNWGSGGVLNNDPVKYNEAGNITGVPRTLRLTFGARF